MDRPVILLLALAADALIGDPPAIWRKVPHPVALFGRLIGWLDRHMNRDGDTPAVRRMAGIGALAVVLLLAAAAGRAIHLGAAGFAAGWAVEALVASVLLAQRSLHLHVGAVALALETGGLAAGRQAVSAIVGRDPDALDQAAVCRAAVESAAENYADGVVAPALWYLIGGLPGLFAYKALNTADSMIGHLSPRHRDFGWASARLDDVANWPAARLSALLIMLAAAVLPGMSAAGARRAALRDAGRPTARSTPAGPRRRWPAASASGSPGRGAMPGAWSRTPGWATAAPKRHPPTSAARWPCSAPPALPWRSPSEPWR
jgi:adenosylcobinamide-phosphate synthase